jgi:hypothetical protein
MLSEKIIAQEIFNAGRMKINLRTIRDPQMNPLYQLWNLKAPDAFLFRRWQFSIPLRFQNSIILRMF